jgi:RimK family alpha-L-glutamate ligase
MNKKILLFTMNNKRRGYEVARVLEEAEKMGVLARHAAYREMQLELNNNQAEVLVGGEKVSAENTFGLWFRVAGTKTGKYPIGRAAMIRVLREKGVFCCNGDSYTKWERMGKIAQHGVYVVNEIPVVPSRIFYTKEQVKKYQFSYPVIVKHDRGFQGRSVRKLNNEQELLMRLDKMDEIKLGMHIWQDYLSLKWDIRVIVIGGKVLGAMKRMAVGSEFRSNFSLGGAVEKYDLSEEDRQIAEKVAKVVGLDYCGVDIMKDENGRSYVLEVNRQCQFQGFEKSTGINVAKAIVSLLTEG